MTPHPDFHLAHMDQQLKSSIDRLPESVLCEQVLKPFPNYLQCTFACTVGMNIVTWSEWCHFSVLTKSKTAK